MTECEASRFPSWQLPSRAPMEIVQCQLATLRDHPKNYRRHTKRQIEHYKASIKEHTQFTPIVLAADCMTILSGHGLRQALMELGITHADCYISKHEPDSVGARRLMRASNEIYQLGEVDFDAFNALLLDDIADGGALLGTGLDDYLLNAFDDSPPELLPVGDVSEEGDPLTPDVAPPDAAPPLPDELDEERWELRIYGDRESLEALARQYAEEPMVEPSQRLIRFRYEA